MIVSVQGCIVVDQQCRGSKGKAKIEGYMRVSDEEAHQCVTKIFQFAVFWNWLGISGYLGNECKQL